MMVGIYNRGSQNFVVDTSQYPKSRESQEVSQVFDDDDDDDGDDDREVGRIFARRRRVQLLNLVSLTGKRGMEVEVRRKSTSRQFPVRVDVEPDRSKKKGGKKHSGASPVAPEQNGGGNGGDGSFVRGGFGRVSCGSVRRRPSTSSQQQQNHGESYNLIEEAEVSSSHVSRRVSPSKSRAKKGGILAGGGREDDGGGKKDRRTSMTQTDVSIFQEEAREVSRRSHGSNNSTRAFQEVRRHFVDYGRNDDPVDAVKSQPKSAAGDSRGHSLPRRFSVDAHRSKYKDGLLRAPKATARSEQSAGEYRSYYVRPEELKTSRPPSFRSVSASPVAQAKKLFRLSAAASSASSSKSALDGINMRPFSYEHGKSSSILSNLSPSSSPFRIGGGGSRSLSPRPKSVAGPSPPSQSPLASSTLVRSADDAYRRTGPSSYVLTPGQERLQRQRRDFLAASPSSEKRNTLSTSGLSQFSTCTPYSSYYNSYSYQYNNEGSRGRGGEEEKENKTSTTTTTREAADAAIATLKSEDASAPKMLSTSNRPILSQKTQGVTMDGLVIPHHPVSTTTYADVHSGEKLTFVDCRPSGFGGDDGGVICTDAFTEGNRKAEETPQQGYQVVVAVDFGTTYSGYAYSFAHDPDSVHIMRKWEGDDPGVSNHKTPTILLLDPARRFHSFGFTARDHYHDLKESEARRWHLFDRFKMILHHNREIGRGTRVRSSSGKYVPALEVFAHSLRYLRDRAVGEIGDALGCKVTTEQVRWVVTVPAIWRQQAKQFMREAAYQAGMGSPECPDQVLVALEPEAASIYCRKLKTSQLVPDRNKNSDGGSISRAANNDTLSSMESDFVLEDPEKSGGRYMVVDCGGGTVDITVHEITSGDDGGGGSNQLREVFKATGGPYGSVSVDEAFNALLDDILGRDLMSEYRRKRPVGFIDLMVAFESRKRSCGPNKTSPLNVAVPYSLITFYKEQKGRDIGSAINNSGSRGVSWATHGMLRLEVKAMKRLFGDTVQKIVEVSTFTR